MTTDDDRDLLEPVALPADQITAHVALVVQGINIMHREQRQFRTEAKERDERTVRRLDEIDHRLARVEKTALNPDQHEFVVSGQRRSAARSQRWASRLTSMDAAVYYLIIVVIGSAILTTHHWIL
jgi:anion-transporting  ArsA/GET3 family ATPase